MRAILRNKATREELYWEKILETKTDYILLGYRVNKYGDKKNKLTLPKAIWEIKTDMGV